MGDETEIAIANNGNQQDAFPVDAEQIPIPLGKTLSPLQQLMASLAQKIGGSINLNGQYPESVPQAAIPNQTQQMSPEQIAALTAANCMIAKELSQGLINKFLPGAGYAGTLISNGIGIGAAYLTNKSQQQPEGNKEDQKKEKIKTKCGGGYLPPLNYTHGLNETNGRQSKSRPECHCQQFQHPSIHVN